ncbi:MAG: NrfD/PsrC family molybdoenzyme membrane anchor subunit [Eubacteriales bacterium]
MTNELNWGFSIALYLFLGGMSAAAYYIAVIADIVGKGKYKHVAEIGSYVVLGPICLGMLMLLLDLGKPLKFWHLMFQNGPLNKGLIFQPGSAMSLGVWLLVGFILICGIAYPLMWLSKSGNDNLRRKIGIVGMPFALLIAVYTGVLLAATSEPVWADTPLLPVLFVLSATSTGIAAIMVIIAFSSTVDSKVVARLEKGDNLLIKIELAVVALLFAALLFSSGAAGLVKNLMFGSYAVFFWVGFILVGLLLPLSIQRYNLQRHNEATGKLALISALLVLFGGFFLRYVVLLAA